MNLEPDHWDERLDAPIERLAAQDAAAPVDVEAALQKVKARFDEPQVLAYPHKRSNRTLLRAAVAALALVGGSLIWKAAQDPPAGQAVPQSHAYDTGVGETERVRLPDGTQAILGPASHLRLVPGYGAGARIVELEGEALFDVQHDDARPFSVRTTTATIRDLGTRFTVRSAGTTHVRVAVTLGSVVLHAASARESSGVTLYAGDVGELDDAGQAILHKGLVSERDTAFAAGTLVFREASMKEVAAELKRWYGVELMVEAPIAARRVTASFSGESISQVLHVIGLALGVQFELEGDTARIVSD